MRTAIGLVMLVVVGCGTREPIDSATNLAGTWSLELGDGDCAGTMALTQTANTVSGTWSCRWSPTEEAVYKYPGLDGDVSGDLGPDGVALTFSAHVFDSAGTPEPWSGAVRSEYAYGSLSGLLSRDGGDFRFLAWR